MAKSLDLIPWYKVKGVTQKSWDSDKSILWDFAVGAIHELPLLQNQNKGGGAERRHPYSGSWFVTANLFCDGARFLSIDTIDIFITQSKFHGSSAISTPRSR